MLRHHVKICTVFVLSITFSSSKADASDWSGQITSYIWIPGLYGSISPTLITPRIKFSKSPAQAIESSDGALFISGLVRRDRFVIVADLSKSKSSRSVSLSHGISADSKVSQKSLTMLAGWRVIQDNNFTVDTLAGFRNWSLSGNISAINGVIDLGRNKNFTDPIIALRSGFGITGNWSGLIHVDSGVTGKGSRTTNQIVAAINYQYSDRLTLTGGYRRLSFDNIRNDTRLDISMSGPIFGATLRF